MDDLDARAGHRLLANGSRTGRILRGPIRPHEGVDVFFYELHEGDNEVFSDVLVVSESEWEPDEFFELVQTIRRRIQDGYIHDTLSEAIAVELERDHGFIHVSDDRLVAVGQRLDRRRARTSWPTRGRPRRRRGRRETMTTTIPSDAILDDGQGATAPSSPSSTPTASRLELTGHLLNRISSTSPSRTR